VFDPEPPGHHPLYSHPDVVLTPHLMGLSRRATAATFTAAARGVLDVLAGREPQAVANPSWRTHRHPEEIAHDQLRLQERTILMNGTVIAAPIRIGVLGAARIADLAIVRPAWVTGHRLVAVAARDRRRAEDFARRYGVDRALDTYADVLADIDVEAIYNPLAKRTHCTKEIHP
jgi:hypothetical protein